MRYCFIKFLINDRESFSRMKNLFLYIKSLKDEELQIPDLYKDNNILNFYTDKELDIFSSGDRLDYEDIFDCIGNGEYYFEEIKEIENNTAFLYFNTISYPYGGVEPIIEFVLSFSMKIISVDNGYMPEYDYE